MNLDQSPPFDFDTVLFALFLNVLLSNGGGSNNNGSVMFNSSTVSPIPNESKCFTGELKALNSS